MLTFHKQIENNNKQHISCTFPPIFKLIAQS